jgi:hypothetical protein
MVKVIIAVVLPPILCGPERRAMFLPVDMKPLSKLDLLSVISTSMKMFLF